MALIIVILTGDFQIHWNVVSLSFIEVKKKVENGPLGEMIFIIIISNDCNDSGKIYICNT